MAFWLLTVQVQQTDLKPVLIIVGKSLWNNIGINLEKKLGAKPVHAISKKCSAQKLYSYCNVLKTHFWISASAQLASTISQSRFLAYRRKKIVPRAWKIAQARLPICPTVVLIFTCLNEERGLLFGVVLCQDLCPKNCNENWVPLLIPANRLVGVG